ncbi:MAG: SagB/ThcOx family dehydrogenase [Candidatus Marinimicrobia bacterium]|nr:SagB/ThcOx family dehydrogenase [Candidatus Neomarinimicrobiota bacterium]
MKKLKKMYQWLRADGWENPDWSKTPKGKGKPAPPLQKPTADVIQCVNLPPVEMLDIGIMPLRDAIYRRASRRHFEDKALTLEELSFLLWATAGFRGIRKEGEAAFRMVPSGGCRHPLETYLAVKNVDGLTPGLYLYQPLNHDMCYLRPIPNYTRQVKEACLGKEFCAEAPVLFIWTAIPYRTEWRFGPVSPKLIAQDSGHVCQNLYLAAESIRCGTCAIGAYHQHKIDELVGVDGVEEFVIYMAPVGKKND